MSLSRTRKKELKRLRSSAEGLWEDQQALLESANAVAREASRQLGNVAREEVVPRVRSGYQTSLEQSRKVARQAGNSAEQLLGNAVGAVLSIGDVANDARVRRAVARITPGRKPEPVKSGPGVGTYLAVGAGIIAAAGVAYAVWQTFRADDELWVAEDETTAL